MLWWLLACGGTGEPAEGRPPSPVPSAPSAAPSAAPAKGSVEGATLFGAYPLCEPSALLVLDDGSLLVADNEGRPADPKDNEDTHPTLWVASGEGAPVPVSREEAAQDAEALARLGDELWIVGSLSRNKECEVKPKRWEIHVLSPGSWTAEGMKTLTPRRVLERKKKEIAEIEGSVSGCQKLLFGGLAEAEPVCTALVEAAKAEQGRPCATLNVEGAAVVDGRVWVGWRAPLVGGRAVLARVAPGHETLAFDAVRLVELGGLGIRELVLEGDRLYGIAGTVLDAVGNERSKLFSVPVSGLADGQLPVQWHDESVPPNAESLQLKEGEVVYLLDGQSPKQAARFCERPAERLVRKR